MKKMKPIGSLLAAGALAALAVCSGCATISTTKDARLDGIVVKGARGAVSEHVCLTTTGEYFLWAIPFGSGKFVWNDQTKTLETETAWFSDCVGLSELQEALQKYAESRNCQLADVVYNDSDTSYAMASYEGIIGIFFGSSSMGVSAFLVPRNDAANN